MAILIFWFEHRGASLIASQTTIISDNELLATDDNLG